MLRKIRITLAMLFFLGITLLFLDFTGTMHRWIGWMAKIQFIPAILALNVGVVLGLIALTLILGRVYCSVICPLGVMQDIFSWLHNRSKKARYRFTYSKAKTALRITILAIFIVAMVAGIAVISALIEPYSAYGRIVQNLLSPIYLWCNNLLAYFAERADSYTFYTREVWIRNIPTFIVAAVTLVALFVLAWRGGRTYCNTICPVGTVLGYLAKFSWLKPVINTDKCNGCGLCAKACKASCISSSEHRIDYSRCIACMDCISNCKQGAIRYMHPAKAKAKETEQEQTVDTAKRSLMVGGALLTAGVATEAIAKKVDGGLAPIVDKQAPKRRTRIVPPGAVSHRHFARHCTACQLCVSACPNNVLRPTSDLSNLMQPEMSYERGYCRPECARCSHVCPNGAIQPIKPQDKQAIQIGHAVWVKKNCIPLTDDVECGNCARHCPVGAIRMMPSEAGNPDSRKIPSVNTERCIGCGACEHLCPARPFSAIYVEGHEVQRNI